MPSLRIFLIAFLCAIVSAQAAVRPLADTYPAEWLGANLQPRAAFKPSPTLAERLPWEAVEPQVRQRHMQEAEDWLGKPWNSLPATGYLDFLRDGDRARYEVLYFERRQRLRSLVLAECLEAKGRFMDDILNGLWLVCEETSWAVPAHLHFQRLGRGLPDFSEQVIDLFAADTGAMLAWTLHLLGPELDRLSPLIRPRIEGEVDRRIMTVFLNRDTFRWMGFAPETQLNNWTPWVVSNVLAASLLLEPAPARRTQIVHRALRILDNFIAQQPADGGCDEGVSYWQHSAATLFECYDLLHVATAGRLDAFSRPKEREMLRYVYRMHIADGWFVNFADGSARIPLEGELVYRIGERINDPLMRGFGAWFLQSQDAETRRPRAISLGRLVPAILRAGNLRVMPAAPPLLRDVWLPDLQVMAARATAGSSRGIYLAALGGHNGENHNHNDVGSCVVFADGQPVLIDVGVETYSARTFGPNRYTIWTMQSAYHNLPTINGQMQGPGAQFAAKDVTYLAEDDKTTFALELAGAYPPEAKVESWRRAYTLHRPDRLTVADQYRLAAPATALDWHFMLAYEPRQTVAGEMIIRPEKGPPVALKFSPDLKIKVETISISDLKLKPVWGETLYRLTLSRLEASAEGKFDLEISVVR